MEILQNWFNRERQGYSTWLSSNLESPCLSLLNQFCNISIVYMQERIYPSGSKSTPKHQIGLITAKWRYSEIYLRWWENVDWAMFSESVYMYKPTLQKLWQYGQPNSLCCKIVGRQLQITASTASFQAIFGTIEQENGHVVLQTLGFAV